MYVMLMKVNFPAKVSFYMILPSANSVHLHVINIHLHVITLLLLFSVVHSLELTK